MSDVVIRVDGLGKRYRIGELQRYKALRDTLTDALYAPYRTATSIINGRRSNGSRPSSSNTIWAIKDVSFDVNQGEVVGIIGRNGAGKSTLLKILSRITEPTEGYAEIHGRVGSLLEVGTGFHPELTGRENIYLNGAILGMRKREIERKFDEIVAFAEVERFIDTPVKHYSSGMYIRLAFAVAAHLEPEVLIVDEVLAVGDAAFQKKCLGKMGEVAKEGRTVLFVSHNMGAVKELCSRVVLLNEGTVLAGGVPQEMIERYLSFNSRVATVPIAERTDRTGTGIIRFTGVRILAGGKEVNCVEWGQDVIFELKYLACQPPVPEQLRLSLTFASSDGTQLLSVDSYTSQLSGPPMPLYGVIRCLVPNFPLIKGIYKAHLYASISGLQADRLLDAFHFEVLSPRYPMVGWATVNHQWDIGIARQVINGSGQ